MGSSFFLSAIPIGFFEKNICHHHHHPLLAPLIVGFATDQIDTRRYSVVMMITMTMMPLLRRLFFSYCILFCVSRSSSTTTTTTTTTQAFLVLPTSPPRSSSYTFSSTSSSSTTRLHVFERISEPGISALVAAQAAATQYQLDTVSVPLVVQGLVQFPETAALQRTFARYRITVRRVALGIAATTIGTTDRSAGWLAGFRAAAASKSNRDEEDEDRPFSTSVQQALTRAGRIADTMQSATVGSHHVLLALLEYDSASATTPTTTTAATSPTSTTPAADGDDDDTTTDTPSNEAWSFLQQLNVLEPNVTSTQFCDTLLQLLRETTKKEADEQPLVTGVTSSSPCPTLDSIGTDLTQQAVDGVLDPVYGRDEEIDRCLRTLLRRRKNCVCLIGDAGVGKTAIAEGIAQVLANHNNKETTTLPLALRGVRVVSIELASLVAGTRYRGDFEERLQSIVQEVIDLSSTSAPVILFLDEIHNLVGAGATEGGMDAANLLKPALARGQLQVIGATTMTEYRKYIEKDAALERRFQPVFCKEPSVVATLDILKAVQMNYERHHQVRYTPAALAAAATLSERYINDRFLPDKALDLLDEAGALVVLERSNGNHNDDSDELPMVTEETIATIVSEFSGIPLGQLQSSELDRLQQLETTMQVRVKGQGRAVRGVARAIRRARSGLRDPNRPVASFLFCGPTGTGKTELCKTLAETYYGSEKDMIRVDMSEYMEKFTVSRLTGPPPGYIGYEEGGQLTEAVRRTPHSVVLLDEIEKAHEDVLNILLQIMEDGMLTDGKGRTVNFKNCILVMTSNVGSRRILEMSRKTAAAATKPSPPTTIEQPSTLSNSGTSVVNGQPRRASEVEPLDPQDILKRMQNNPQVGSLLMRASTDSNVMKAIQTAMSGSPADLQRAAQENPVIANFLQDVWNELSEDEDGMSSSNDDDVASTSGLDQIRGSFQDTMAQWNDESASTFVRTVAEQVDDAASSTTSTTSNGDQYKELSGVVKEELELAMKPELLNRIDEIVVFSPLSGTDLRGIAQRNIKIIVNRAEEEHDLNLEIDEELIDRIVAEGSANADQFGARPMRRAAQRFIEDSLSEGIVEGFLQQGSKAVLSLGSPSSSGENNNFVRISMAEKSLDVRIEDGGGGIGSAEAPTQQFTTNNGVALQTEATQ